MQLPAPNGWGRWHHSETEMHQNGTDNDYVNVMMAPPMMVSSSAPLQRPTMAPHFVMNDSPYSAPSPVSSLAATHYQAFSIAPFANGLPAVAPPPSPSPTTIMNPHHHAHQPRYPLRISTGHTELQGSVATLDARESDMKQERMHSSSRRQTKPVPAATNPTVSDTPMDKVMRLIQNLPDIKRLEQPGEPATEHKDSLAVVTGGKSTQVCKFVCVWEGCGELFKSKTQLETHTRVHTGEKPFACPHEGCPKRFTQQGNRDSHYIIHLGQKPHKCDICGAAFAQRGQVYNHKKSRHEPPRFKCELEGCNRPFPCRGNLKTHQNKQHTEYVQRFMSRLKADPQMATFSAEDRAVLEYLAPLHCNLNKGIKGRGQGVFVERVPGAVSPARARAKARSRSYRAESLSSNSSMSAGGVATGESPPWMTPTSSPSTSPSPGFSVHATGAGHSPVMASGPAAYAHHHMYAPPPPQQHPAYYSPY